MTYLWIYIKGMMMGVADLVPGVSGGTIALLVGIYERLISAIASVNGATLALFFKGQFKAFWKAIDGWFLLALFAGIISSIVLLASLIKWLLATHAIVTWAFFFGLIIAAAGVLLWQQGKGRLQDLLFLVIGVVLCYLLSSQSGDVLPKGLLGIFLAGCIAICAMILPGLSGSLLLLLLGKYQTLLSAVEDRDFMLLLTFAFGCLVGLLTFSKVLKFLLSKYHRAMIYFLAGLMLGTLPRVWPWRLHDAAASPMQFEQPLLLGASLSCAMAVVLVLVLSRFGKER